MTEVDVLVIGAGIHGAGVAQAAAAAGYSVRVLEKETVACGTSSKSSKLIHGGLRYLESYQFSLVRKSLKERAVLTRLAPALVKLQPFYIPIYSSTTRRPWKVRLGLILYAILGGLRKENAFKKISRKKLSNLDQLEKTHLNSIFQYYDGQTNDVALTKAVMKSANQLGATLINPVEITSIKKSQLSFEVSYKSSSLNESIQAKVVINASGPWVNELLDVVEPKASILDIDLVQGTHIIIDAPAPSGIYYLEAIDKRAVFVMPYEYNGEVKTMIGTTEKLFIGKADDVIPSNEEVEYLQTVYQSYFPTNDDFTLLDKFAGLRVLPKNNSSMFSRPRDTILHWSLPGLLTLYGGKLTAYRSTADLVIKKIKPFITKRKRVAYTDQLYLTPEN